jgi:hypothetical protein
MQNSMANTTFC